MTDLTELHNRLNSLQDSLKQTSQLVVKLAVDSQSSPALSTDIHEALKQSEEDLELLQQDIEDLAPAPQQNSSFRRAERSSVRASERDRQYAQLSATCGRLAEELKLAHARFRKAQMQAKRNADRALTDEQLAYMEDLRATAESYHATLQEAESKDQGQNYTELRNSLFGSRKYGGKTNSSSTKDDMILSASSDLTSSLRQTHDLLSSELSRSRFAHETLESSNSALQELNKRYGTLDDLLSKSRGLLGSLLRSQKSDTWYLETALYILLATITWLLFRRILYGPAWWLLWQPLRLVWKVFAGVFGVLGLAPGGRSSASKSTSLIVQPSATGGPPIIERGAAQSIRVGGGGRGWYAGDSPPDMPDSASRTPYSDQVESIVQATQSSVDATETASTARPQSTEEAKNPDAKGEEGTGSGSGAKKEKGDEEKRKKPIQRGDGEELKERDPEANPPNPKKRMWEEPRGKPESKDEL